MGKEPSHLPHVGDAHASLLIGQPFRCFGWLKSVQYYRGDPYAEAFLGLWHNETETTFVLRNKLKLMPDSVGIHSVTISDQWLVSTGDYLGIHYPRASRSGAVSYAKTSDNLFDEQNFYQAAILPIYEEDIFPNAPISVNLEDIQFEPRLFAIQGDYTPEYTHQGKLERQMFSQLRGLKHVFEAKLAWLKVGLPALSHYYFSFIAFDLPRQSFTIQLDDFDFAYFSF